MIRLILVLGLLFGAASCDRQKALSECLTCGEGRYWACSSGDIPLCPEGEPVCWDSNDRLFCPR